MKQILVLLIAASAFLQMKAQDLLKQGAEWHYTMTYFSIPDIGFNRCYIDGDTLIQDKECLIYYQEENCNGRPVKNFLHKENDQVFFYDEANMRFKLLYDFSLEVGDTMELESWFDRDDVPYYIRVDSIGTYTRNEVDLKLFNVTYGYLDRDGEIMFSEDFFVEGVIIEDIGNVSNFFHLWDDGFCDYQYSNELRCFSTPDYATVQIGEVGCQTVPTTDLSGNLERGEAYPNPFYRKLNIRLSDPLIKGKVTLYDLAGRIVYQEDWPSGMDEVLIPVEDLNPSIYWVDVIPDDGTQRPIFRRKIVKIGD